MYAIPEEEKINYKLFFIQEKVKTSLYIEYRVTARNYGGVFTFCLYQTCVKLKWI